MDNQNFNDQELSDIMKEIESLEEEFTGEKPQSSPVMKELAEMDEVESVPQPAPAKKKHVEVQEPQAEVYHIESKQKPHSSMKFKVEGQMSIELQFEIGGKVVCVDVAESGLSIQMEGGVTFTVPVDSHKKSA